jgi:tRNA pseudouridine55 synthase
MNRLFVGYKPTGMSSNRFLGQIKRKYKVKKAGYSGTLDPFAKGVLIVALGHYTRLFRFLDKTPKSYRATLWLGAHSDTLDIEGVEQINTVAPLAIEQVEAAVASLQGKQTYLPPIYSAKSIDGQRAYALAREGKEVTLQPITSMIHDAKLIHYCHPFVTFEVTVSEGTYVRSLGVMIAKALDVEGAALSALERLQEGQFRYNNESALTITDVLNIPPIRYHGDPEAITYGRPLVREAFPSEENGTYWLTQADRLTIIELADDGVHYVLNNMPLA